MFNLTITPEQSAFLEGVCWTFQETSPSIWLTWQELPEIKRVRAQIDHQETSLHLSEKSIEFLQAVLIDFLNLNTNKDMKEITLSHGLIDLMTATLIAQAATSPPDPDNDAVNTVNPEYGTFDNSDADPGSETDLSDYSM